MWEAPEDILIISWCFFVLRFHTGNGAIGYMTFFYPKY